MPNYRRSYLPGGTYFFTLVTHQRQPLLLEPAFLQALRASFREVRRQLPFDLPAWVLLPDHLHALVVLPRNDPDYSLRISLLKQGVSQRCAPLFKDPKRLSASRIKRRESTLWQRRFWEHQVRDESDLELHMDYLHYNPVKHGLVAQATDWPYSTFHRYVKRGLYQPDWGRGVTFSAELGGE